MQVLLGILLILALALAGPITTSDGSRVSGSVSVQTGTEGTNIDVELQTPGDPKIIVDSQVTRIDLRAHSRSGPR